MSCEVELLVKERRETIALEEIDEGVDVESDTFSIEQCNVSLKLEVFCV